VTLSDNKILTIAAGRTASTGAVTLTAVDNDVDAADLEVAVSATATGGNGVAAPAGQTLTVTDDDARGVTVSVQTLTVRESDDAGTADTKEHEATYTVALDSKPAAGTVAVAVESADTKIATVSPASLVFTTTDWNAPKTVTVTGVNDDTDNAGDKRTVRLTHRVTATGTGTDYGTVTADPVEVTITDDDAPPSLSIDGPSVAEGDSGTAALTFTVALGAASGRQVTVAYADAGTGTATSATDYAAVAGGTLTFAPGETSKTIGVTVNGDTTDEKNETVVLRLSSPSNATVATADGTGTITDDDDPPTVKVDDAQAVTEGDDPATTADMTFPVTLSAASGKAVTVAYTLGGTAGAGADYTAPSPLSLTIAAGSAGGSIVVPVKGDELDEPNETVEVTLGALTNATLNPAQGAGTAAGTITDDDGTPAATLVLTPATINESGSGNASTVKATLSAATSQALTLTVSAGAGVTLSANKTLTIAAGQTASTGAVTLTAADNDVDAADLEVTVSATATGGNGVAAPADATLTVTDDDARGVTVSAETLTVRESDDTATTAVKEHEATYTVVLDSKPAAGTVAVAVQSADDKAATVSPTSLTFTTTDWNAPKTVTVTGVDDATDNAGDKRTARLTHTVTAAGEGTDYGAVTAKPVTVTVTDDDDAPGAIALSVDAASVGEGAGATAVTVTASITDATRFAEAQAVAVRVGGGTATSGADYAAVAGFNVGIPAMAASGSASFTLTPTDDDVDEANETIDVTGTLSGATVTKATISLTDDDTRGVAVTGGPLTLDEADDPQTEDAKENQGAYTVALTSEPTAAVVVNLSAGASAPVTLDKTRLTFAPAKWSEAQTVTVTAVDDAYDNPGDKRTASITHTIAAGGSDYGPVTAAPVAVTVTDDDAAPSSVTLSVDADTGTDGVQSSVAEGGGAKTVRVTATLAGDSRFPTAKTVALTVGKATDSAVEGTDYGTVGAVSITIAADAASGSATFTLTPTDDAIDDDAESLTIEGGVTGEAGVTVSPASIAIDDDDGAPSGIALSVNPASVAENAATAATVTVTAAVAGGSAYADAKTVTVSVGAAGDDAVSGTDYAAVPNFDITIPAGASSATGTFSLDPTDDAIAEGAETLTVSGASGSLDVTDAEVTITDNEATPTATLVLTPATIDESGNGNASTVTATLSGAASEALTLTVSAGAGVTLSANKTLTIAAGRTESTGAVTLTAADNDVDAADLEVTVSATADGGNGVAAPAGQTLTVTDDDARGVTVDPTGLTIAEADNTGTADTKEHEKTYTVALDSQPAAGTVAVAVESADANIATVSPARLTFTTTNWNRPQPVTVTAVADAIDNPNDKRTARLTHTVTAAGEGTDYGAVTADPVEVTVTDDDGAPTLSVGAPSVAEGDSGKANLDFVATLSPASGREVTVAYTDAGTGTATPAADYDAVAAGTLTFAPGATSRTVRVAALGDTVDEANETVVLRFASPVNAALSGGGTTLDATGTITDDDSAALSIADATAAEGATATFAVTLSTPSAQAVTVTATTSEGSATDPEDYTHKTQALTIAAGDTRAEFAVAIASDTVAELDETFTVTLSNASGATIAAATATGTITGADALLSIADASAAEGDALTFIVTRTGDTTTAATVQWTTADDTTDGAVKATAGADYTAQATAATLNFKAGDTSATFTVATTGDTIDESDETFRVVLASPSNGLAIADGTAIATITDDDAAPTGITLSAAPAAIGEQDDMTEVTVTATVNGATRYNDAVTVTVSVGGGTATSATDYAAVEDFDITIAAGQASATGTFDLTPTQDSVHEGAETIDVTGDAGTLTVTKATLSLTDDDAAPSFAIADASAAEGEAITFTVTRSGATGEVATVKWTTADDPAEGARQATAGADYTAVSTARTLSFAAGDTQKTFTVATAADILTEGDETFVVKLSDATGAAIADGTATGTITDDDTAPTALTLSVDADTGAEGIQTSIAENAGAKSVRVTATLAGASTFATPTTVTVKVGKVADSAKSGADYTAVADRTITIPAGASSGSATFTLTPIQDTTWEDDETISLDGSAGTLSVTDAAITLTDDETAPTATLVLTPATINESGNGNASTVTATLSAASSEALTLTVSAGAGVTLSDNKILTIAAGRTASTGAVTLTAVRPTPWRSTRSPPPAR